MIGVYLLIGALLLLLNAFFVLAEFAAVKMRPTRVDELVEAGDGRARVFKHVQTHLDEYLSVCQVGITFASIGLGFVGEPSIARLVEPLVAWAGAATPALAHSIALTAVRFFYFLFYPPLVVLNGSANLILRLMGLPPRPHDEAHSQQELKIILARSQAGGLISFRRLLFIENIFDLEGVKVRHAMRPTSDVKHLRVGAPWLENERVIRETRFSRYPLVDSAAPLPVGIVHVKDLYYSGPGEPDSRSWRVRT